MNPCTRPAGRRAVEHARWVTGHLFRIVEFPVQVAREGFEGSWTLLSLGQCACSRSHVPFRGGDGRFRTSSVRFVGFRDSNFGIGGTGPTMRSLLLFGKTE